MADRRIWPTNNIVDLEKVAEAFGLPGDLKDVEIATQSVEYTLSQILIELQRIRLGMSILVDNNLEDVYPDL